MPRIWTLLGLSILGGGFIHSPLHHTYSNVALCTRVQVKLQERDNAKTLSWPAINPVINYNTPTELEVKAVVLRFMSHNFAGHAHLRAKHLKGWMRVAYLDRDTNTHTKAWWEKLVTLVKHILEQSMLPTNLICIILVLIPKWNSDTWGVCFPEVLWKVSEAIINTRVKTSVKLLEILHRFCANLVTGMAIMDVKMV